MRMLQEYVLPFTANADYLSSGRYTSVPRAIRPLPQGLGAKVALMGAIIWRPPVPSSKWLFLYFAHYPLESHGAS